MLDLEPKSDRKIEFGAPTELAERTFDAFAFDENLELKYSGFITKKHLLRKQTLETYLLKTRKLYYEACTNEGKAHGTTIISLISPVDRSIENSFNPFSLWYNPKTHRSAIAQTLPGLAVFGAALTNMSIMRDIRRNTFTFNSVFTVHGGISFVGVIFPMLTTLSFHQYFWFGDKYKDIDSTYSKECLLCWSARNMTGLAAGWTWALFTSWAIVNIQDDNQAGSKIQQMNDMVSKRGRLFQLNILKSIYTKETKSGRRMLRMMHPTVILMALSTSLLLYTTAETIDDEAAFRRKAINIYTTSKQR
jgi:hypothetical protein